MAEDFFKQPILNSPYEYPARHWVLDEKGQPTKAVASERRPVKLATAAVPRPKRQKAAAVQGGLDLKHELDTTIGAGIQEYDPEPIIRDVRKAVDAWRALPDPRDWKVTPETARLLKHWRSHRFQGIRPFFCQIEAVETAIWLHEVAPKAGKLGQRFIDHLAGANGQANPGLDRLALKLATGAGKTTVMAMLIAWQTVNAVRRPSSKRFTKAFLVVTPGITIRDRLRVLLPNDPDAYYAKRELVPPDMLGDLGKARIVITNFHAFKLRETWQVAKGTKALLTGPLGEPLQTLETEGKMIQRVMSDLMHLKNVMVLNDEAHHCYRERPGEDEEGSLKGDDRKEAEKNREAARLWLTGLETVGRHMGVLRVMDLSATPFFLRGSGYAEGTLFPWTMSDFSLMDAIECGIVKLPRVPVADNLPIDDMPIYRNLWEHIRKGMPTRGRGNSGELNPLDLPPKLIGAMDALYGHYEQVFAAWQAKGNEAPPCFIIVCNNTSTSKLVYDYVSGFEHAPAKDGTRLPPHTGMLPLFSNYDENGQRLPRPRTLLIDSEQLESGDAIDPGFRKMAGDEIDRFRREMLQRGAGQKAADNITDQDLLREVMNTVGKPGTLGESIRCVVSVSMLTEGWDANTVTHILGIRAFGTQLLCEQVIGRALRRRSYDLNEDGRFDVEYADVLGIPFDFTAKPVVAPVKPPKESVVVRAISPDREASLIRFPRVEGYRVRLPGEKLRAKFTEESRLPITPGLVGPTQTLNEGILGEGVKLSVSAAGDVRTTTLVYHLTRLILQRDYRDANGDPELHLFGQLRAVVEAWLAEYVEYVGGTKPWHLLIPAILEEAANRIKAAILRESAGEKCVEAILSPYEPIGSTASVHFSTSREDRWKTRDDRCHVNWVVCDSTWEAEFCRVVEEHPRVRSYVKNHGLGFSVPYHMDGEVREYRPDFIARIDDGHGDDDLLNLVVEVKGYRREDAKRKKETMETHWIPGVNRWGGLGRWAFAEFSEPFAMEQDLDEAIAASVTSLIEDAVSAAEAGPASMTGRA